MSEIQSAVPVELRDATKWPRCGKCNTIWRQSGNRTGHCSLCHRTFDGETAFNRHQTTNGGKVTCHDPMERDDCRVRAGSGPYDLEVFYFGIEATMPEGIWD